MFGEEVGGRKKDQLFGDAKNALIQVAVVSFLPMTMRTLGDYAMWGNGSVSETYLSSGSSNAFSLAIICAEFLAVGYVFLIRPMKKESRFSFLYATIVLTAGIVAMLIATQLSLPDSALSVFESLAAMTLVFSRLVFWVVVVRAFCALREKRLLVAGIAFAGYGLSSIAWNGLLVAFGSSAELLVSLLVAYALITLIMLVCEKTNKAWDPGQGSGVRVDCEGDTLVDSFVQKCTDMAEAYRLSPRETEVFILLAQGNTRQSIQEKLFLSDGTVKTHTKRIYDKLGIHSRQEMFDKLFGNE